MRDEWRTALQEPFAAAGELPASSETEHDDTPLAAVVSIVALAAMVLATVGAMTGACTLSSDSGPILAAAAGALLIAFAGSCVVTYQRRTWAHAATLFTGIAFVFVIVGFADRTSEMHRFAETGSTCQSDIEGD